MSDSNIERVVVTVHDQHLPTIQSVAQALQTAGLRITNVLPTTGIITGEVSSQDMHALATVPGVVSVEPDREMHAI
jgi:hypothetical protein